MEGVIDGSFALGTKMNKVYTTGAFRGLEALQMVSGYHERRTAGYVRVDRRFLLLFSLPKQQISPQRILDSL